MDLEGDVWLHSFLTHAHDIDSINLNVVSNLKLVCANASSYIAQLKECPNEDSYYYSADL